MKTASISYRVADFLKQHAPFQHVLEEDLLRLAQSGRVKFHETDEYILRQGAPRGPNVFVIQQGRVDLLDERDGQERLRDVLGPGDMVGFGRFLGASDSLFSARTAGDVLLYAFQGEILDEIVARYPKVARYFAAYFSVSANYELAAANGAPLVGAGMEPGGAHWVFRKGEIEGLAAPTVVICLANEPIREAAKRMALENAPAVAVVDEEQVPLGYVMLEDFRDRVATGEVSVDAPIGDLMHLGLPTARTGLPAGQYVARMLKSRSPVLAITENYTGVNRVRALITGREIALLAGANPAVLAARLSHAQSADELSSLWQRMEDQIRRGMTERSLVEWYADVVSEMQTLLFSRLVELAEQEVVAEGRKLPDLPRCWVLFGGAARREVLTRFDFDHGLIFADPPEKDEREIRDVFARVGQKVVDGLRRCGFQFSPAATRADDERWRLSLSEWKERYSGWIGNPIGTRIYESRSFFEQRWVQGERRLLDSLREHAQNELAAHGEFILLLANDCLANLPPLTFFEGLVVDDAGVEKNELDLRRSTLFPVNDVGRVLGLACGELDKVSTTERFLRAVQMFPERKNLFDDAINALNVALYHRARAGLQRGDDGATIQPAGLSKLDQQLLKTAFRTTLELLQFTAETYSFKA